MTTKEFLELVKKSFDECYDIMIKKGHDYATEESKFANFNRVAEVCRILKVDVSQPHGVIMFFIIGKIDRIQNLLSSGKTAKNESILDSVRDLINYCYLFFGKLMELSQNKKEE